MPSIPLIVNQRDAIRLYAVLKDSFSDLRGFDLVSSLGKRVRIPRTTNADVRMLLGQWNRMVLDAGGIGTTASKKMIEKWLPAQKDMVAEAAIEEPEEIFSDNLRFWNTTAKLAIALEGVGITPDAWTMAVEAISEAAAEAPELISDITKGAADAVVKVAGAIARGAGKVVGGAAGGFFEGFGFVGIALLAGAAYVYTKKRKAA